MSEKKTSAARSRPRARKRTATTGAEANFRKFKLSKGNFAGNTGAFANQPCMDFGLNKLDQVSQKKKKLIRGR